ncbi:hypothetical protein [Actinomycetospora cinnamomea]|uniref:Uncharacterized protein n=1 Tax=Actinomycetospora cinnamomea TaxID=663609 RepID=A0A2U1F7R6_9PSEU|nr:hypothetical protein [Actinomycetospora cinnamomea]PVZ08189.1 hypothetical protein C8D89_10972 [Actinomycetospora cinnamomea]
MGPDLDVPWAAKLAEAGADAFWNYRGRDAPSPAEHALAGELAVGTAVVVHALGGGPDEVRIWFARAAGALMGALRAPGPVRWTVAKVTPDGATRTERQADDSLASPERAQLARWCALLAGDDAPVEDLGARGHMADALGALERGERPRFRAALHAVLVDHRRRYAGTEHEPRALLFLPALGLAALGLRARLVSRADLPAADPLLPGSLL